MKKNPFISYIVPCYNLQDYLPRCLESLSRQEIRDNSQIEFILVNDGATDNTPQLLGEYEKKEPRAVIINQYNQGVSVARNNGLHKAQGEYVFFLDGDDYLTDNASQAIFDICRDGKPDIVITNAYRVIDGKFEDKIEWNNDANIEPGIYNPLDYAKRASRLPISFKAYRRDMLVKNKIFYDNDLQVGEVYTFFIHALTYAKSIAFSDLRIMNYVIRGTGVMQTANLQRDLSLLITMHKINTYAESKMPVLIGLIAYKRSLFDIINIFSIVNYSRNSTFTPEIGAFLETIKKDKIYKDLLRFFIFKDNGLNTRTFFSLLQLLPVSVSYRFLRLARKLSK